MPSFRLRRSRTGNLMGLAAIGLAAIGLSVWFTRSTEPTHAIELAATGGNVDGLRHRLLVELAREGAIRDLRIRSVPTAGSEDALRAVDARRVDVALVQGGLDMTAWRHVRQVAALDVEPLHLLVRPELAEEGVHGLARLKGRRINLSEPGTGSHQLALAVLDFVRLPPGSYEATTWSYEQILDEANAERLPDAIFLVSTLPSPVAEHLVQRHGYQLLPLPFGEAFSLGSLKAPLPGERPLPRSDAGRINPEHIYDAQIPAFTYQVEPPVPPETIHTLGARMLVVAHERVPAASVSRLLDVIFGSRFAMLAHPPLDAALLDLPPEMPRHSGTVLYQQRNQPLIAGDVIDLADKLVGIGGPLLGGLFCLWQWYRFRAGMRSDQRFESYILKVAEIERQTNELELAPSMALDQLVNLRRRLLKLKGEALERFANGEIDGKDLVSGFLLHVNDAHTYLTRLILHERDNLEQEAELRGRSLASLWKSAIAPGAGGATETSSASVAAVPGVDGPGPRSGEERDGRLAASAESRDARAAG